METMCSKVSRFVRGFGFTLAELIVVITILAILATVGFLAFSGYARDANVSAMKANARSVYSAISAESAVTGNSPRYYVVHDSSAALSSAIVVIDGKSNVLTGGAWNAAWTNYSAGNPDYVMLKLNPDKFRITRIPLFDSALAAYVPGAVSIWAADLQSWTSSRTYSAVQVSATSPSTWAVAVVGSFPPNSSSTVAGLIKSPSSTGALVDETSVSVASLSVSLGYPGCADADITLANGQVWAACNVGASRAYDSATDVIIACSSSPSDCNASNRTTFLWGVYQWWRNDNLVPALTPTTTLAPTGTKAWGVGHSKLIIQSGIAYHWITTRDPDLWGASGSTNTVGTYSSASFLQKDGMRWPCSAGYHVPTPLEWANAITSVTWSPLSQNFADSTKYAQLVGKLKLPMGWRMYSVSGSAYFTSANAYSTYWSSVDWWQDYAYGVSFDPASSTVRPAQSESHVNANPVRCIKDN